MFASLYLASTALSIANIWTSYGALRAHAISQGLAAAGPLVAMLMALLSGLLFWHFIARRGSNVAKWLLIALSALSLLQLPQAVAYTRMFGWVYGLTFAASGAALLGALVTLFRADAIAWLTDRDERKAINLAVFD